MMEGTDFLLIAAFIIWCAVIDCLLLESRRYRKLTKIEFYDNGDIALSFGNKKVVKYTIDPKYQTLKSWFNMVTGKRIVHYDCYEAIVFMHKQGVDVVNRRFLV